jgi:hypothetical protein
MIVGPRDMPGEESFDITVCSPEWLADPVWVQAVTATPRH